MRILAVDNDPFIIQVLELALGAMGFGPITTARSAAEALERIRNADEDFDCLLLDIRMPETDGIALCGMVRRIPGYERTPILMLTAMSERKYVERAFEAGANDVISKPFETVELAARIRVAEKLAREIRSKEGVERDLSAMTCASQVQPKVSFDDALAFEDMPGHLDLPSLRNYLERIKRSDFRYGGVMALAVRDMADIHARMNGRDFIDFVSDVGEAISLTLSHERIHFSYAGAGHFLILFLCVPRRGFAAEVRWRVQQELNRMDLRYPDHSPIGATIEVSRIQGTELFGANDVDAVIRAAIGDVEAVLAADARAGLGADGMGHGAALRVGQ